MDKTTHQIKIENLPKDSILLKKIYIKPYTAIYIILAAGILLAVTRTSAWILGVLMIALSLFALFFVNDRVQMEIYDDYAVIYPDSKSDECTLFHWSEAAEWGIKHEASGDYLTVRLKDGSIIRSSINNSSAVYRALNKKMPKLETSYLLQQKINEKKNAPSKFKWPWQRKKK
jgi:hypothetical protein